MRTGKKVGAVAAVLALIVTFSAPPSAGQTPGARPDDPLTFKQAGREFLDDVGKVWTSPLRLKDKHVGPLIALAASTAFLIAADENIRHTMKGYANEHAWVGDVSPVITEMGSVGALATAGTFFAAGLVLKDAKARDTGYLAASAMVQVALVNNVLKGLAGRQRPFYADGIDHWSGPVAFFKRFDKDAGGRYLSFPSGHTATAFALATVVARQYRHPSWVPIVAYGVAAGVGISRMPLDLHWASDILVGAVLGHLVARLVVNNHARRQRLVPALACSGRAVAFSVHYDLDPPDR